MILSPKKRVFNVTVEPSKTMDSIFCSTSDKCKIDSTTYPSRAHYHQTGGVSMTKSNGVNLWIALLTAQVIKMAPSFKKYYSQTGECSMKNPNGLRNSCDEHFTAPWGTIPRQAGSLWRIRTASEIHVMSTSQLNEILSQTGGFSMKNPNGLRNSCDKQAFHSFMRY